jgi:hypothetical protein
MRGSVKPPHACFPCIGRRGVGASPTMVIVLCCLLRLYELNSLGPFVTASRLELGTVLLSMLILGRGAGCSVRYVCAIIILPYYCGEGKQAGDKPSGAQTPQALECQVLTSASFHVCFSRRQPVTKRLPFPPTRYFFICTLLASSWWFILDITQKRCS